MHEILLIIVNVILPIVILNKMTAAWGAVPTLLVALAFPIAGGIYEKIKANKWSMISLLGFVNILITGALALSGLNGIWFALKEAIFPSLVGLFVFYSAKTSSPFMQTLFLNPKTVKVDLLKEKIEEKGMSETFQGWIQSSTRQLSLSFFMSAVINFAIGLRVFAPILETLSFEERNQILNKQIAEMHSMSFMILTVPSFLAIFFIFTRLLKKIEATTGIKSDDLFV